MVRDLESQFFRELPTENTLVPVKKKVRVSPEKGYACFAFF